MTYGPSLLEQLWADADSAYSHFVQIGHDPTTTKKDAEGYQRGYLNCICKTLSLFMPPHFTTPAEIAGELAKRYQMKEADEHYETPGLTARRYEPPPGDHKYDTTHVAAIPTKLKHNLPPERVAKIRSSAADADTLALAFGVSVAVIQSIRESSD